MFVSEWIDGEKLSQSQADDVQDLVNVGVTACEHDDCLGFVCVVCFIPLPSTMAVPFCSTRSPFCAVLQAVVGEKHRRGWLLETGREPIAIQTMKAYLTFILRYTPSAFPGLLISLSFHFVLFASLVS